MSVDFQCLLAIRDQRRAACSSPEIDAIIIAELKGRMLTALRTAIDQLETIDCARKPGVAARVDAELEWIRAIVKVFSSGRDT
jgi:hypothetical protein